MTYVELRALERELHTRYINLVDKLDNPPDGYEPSEYLLNRIDEAHDSWQTTLRNRIESEQQESVSWWVD